MADTALPKVKHLSAQTAMHADLSIALSQGFGGCGQQSMSSIAATPESPIAAMSVISDDFATAAKPPNGSTTTDRAIRSANMVRTTFMTHGKIADFALAGSSDEFASALIAFPTCWDKGTTCGLPRGGGTEDADEPIPMGLWFPLSMFVGGNDVLEDVG
jgi:hypothetical protein